MDGIDCGVQFPAVLLHPVLCSVAQSCLTLCNPMDCSPPGFSVHGDSPGKNTRVSCHAPQTDYDSNIGFPLTVYNLGHVSSVQFSSVTQSCLTLCDPMYCSTPGFPVHLPELTQTHQVGDAIQPSHPLLSPSPPAFSLSQHQGLFQ